MCRQRSHPFLAIAFLVLALVLNSVMAGAIQAQSSVAPSHRSLATVVRRYFATLNGDLHTGNMSSLSQIYGANATLTVKGLNGVTTVYRGLAQIKGFWSGMAKVPGLRFHEDRMLLLDTVHAAAYEHGSTRAAAIDGRCAHLFKIINGHIVTDSYIWLPLHATTLRVPIKSGQDYHW